MPAWGPRFRSAYLFASSTVGSSTFWCSSVQSCMWYEAWDAVSSWTTRSALESSPTSSLPMVIFESFDRRFAYSSSIAALSKSVCCLRMIQQGDSPFLPELPQLVDGACGSAQTRHDHLVSAVTLSPEGVAEVEAGIDGVLWHEPVTTMVQAGQRGRRLGSLGTAWLCHPVAREGGMCSLKSRGRLAKNAWVGATSAGSYTWRRPRGVHKIAGVAGCELAGGRKKRGVCVWLCCGAMGQGRVREKGT